MQESDRFSTLGSVLAEARLNVSPRIWDFIEGGSSAERGLLLNRAAFDEYLFEPDMLTGLSYPRTQSTLLGIPMSMPVFVSPFGFDKAIHPAGYPAVARAVADAGITSIVSESSSDSLTELAPHFSGQQGLVQLALSSDEEHMLGFEERAAAAGYRGLCLTDSTTGAWRERTRESGRGLHEHFGMGNYGEGRGSVEKLREWMAFTTPRWDWQRLEGLASQLTLPWIFKGVISTEIAKRAVDAGAAGIYVSSYGGRNLDGTVPSLMRLASIVEAVDGRVPVLLDSGVRHGTDIAKALALGASAVGIGRLAAFGLAAGSLDEPASGVASVLHLLRGELESVMGSLGCEAIGDLQPHHLTLTRDVLSKVPGGA